MSQPLRICFYCADQNPERDRTRGITNYTTGLISHLHERNKVELEAVVSKSSFAIPKMLTHELPFRTDHIAGRLLADHFHPLFASKSSAQIWHYPKGFLPALFQVRQPKVGTIHDTILQHYADHHSNSRSRIGLRYWIEMLKHSLERFDVVLTVSQFSRRSIIAFCDRHQLKCPRIVVTYLGIAELHSRVSPTPAKEDVVVHLASPLPHKRTNWLLDLWSALESTANNLPKLVLIGRLDYDGSTRMKQLSNVQHYESLARTKLLELIAKARALLLPSEVEGFGLPAAEAYCVGTPVAYARGHAVEEILAANCSGGFEFRQDSFLQALQEVLGLTPEQIAAKANELRATYSWQRTVDLTLDAYQSVL